jgi:hypothetical protein
MPPDVVRPMASTRLGDLLVIGHRLGMDWIDVRPSENVLRARRNGKSLTAFEIRGLGLALRYTDKDPQRDNIADLFVIPTSTFMHPQSLSPLSVPTTAVDKMAFGFIPSDADLGTEEYCLWQGPKKYEGIQQVFTQLGVEWDAMYYCTRGAAGECFFDDRWFAYHEPTWNAACDAIYVLSPWLPIPGSRASKVRLPCRSEQHTPFNWREGYVTLWLRLQDLVTSTQGSTQTTIVFQHLNALATQYSDNFVDLYNLPNQWRSHYGGAITTVQGLRDLKEMYDAAVAYLRDLPFPYVSLVAAHIEMAVHSHKLVAASESKGWRKCARFNDELHYFWMVELAHQYVDNISYVQEAMQRRHRDVQPDMVRGAWWTMVLKAITWKFSVQPHGAHAWDSYTPWPSHFWESDMPIYIM